MKTVRSSWSIIVPLVVLGIFALVWTQNMSVSGDHGIEGKQHLTEIDEDSDEIDPEACQTTTEKELKGPINTSFLATATSTVLDLPGEGDILREQMIVKIIAACNVDDEVVDPNLERDLDVDIEVFSIICEERADLSVAARCEVLRVAQETNAPFILP